MSTSARSMFNPARRCRAGRLPAAIALGLLALATATGRAEDGSGRAEDGPAMAELPSDVYLGVFTGPLPAALRAQLADALNDRDGLIVHDVVPGSPAARAGIQPHDLVLSIEDRPVATVSQLREAVSRQLPGDRIELTLLRRSRPLRLEATLTERPAASASPDRKETASSTQRVAERSATQAAERLTRQNGNAVRTAQVRGNALHGTPNDSALRVTCSATGEYTIRWEPTSAERAKEARTVRAAREELAQSLAEWPEEVRQAATAFAEETTAADRAEKPTQSVRVQVRPRLRDGEAGVQVTIHSCSSDGERRTLCVDQSYVEGKPPAWKELLALEPLRRELEAQSPAIRKQVEEALLRTKIPEVRVDVQRAQ